MKAFMDMDFLLGSPTARSLYHETAATLPIIDYHCHINPDDIVQNRRFQTITELWLGADHYKWRLMRGAGVPEDEITGALQSDPALVFSRWAETLRGAAGHPLYHWTHLELQRYFDIHEPLCPENAAKIYEACNRKLAEDALCVRGILQSSKVELLCTTDDPADELSQHKALRADQSLSTRVLPCFRPEKAFNVDKPGFAAYIEQLGTVCGGAISCFNDLRGALLKRCDYFHENGCRAGDHALPRGFFAPAGEASLEAIFQKGMAGERVSEAESEEFITALLLPLCRKYHQLGWVAQIHFGCLRNLNSRRFASLGADTGFDCINADSRPLRFAPLLDALRRDDALPRMILYSLNPNDNAAIAVMLGCFADDAGVRGKLQLGAAWWFNDTQNGMRAHLRDYAECARLCDFVGMLTDSRSIVSYPRHEYFRRILCDILGNWVENGEFPNDRALLHGIVCDICHDNAMRLFGF